MVKKIIKQFINSVGYDLHRLSAAASPDFQLLQSLKNFNVDMILDVGANVGQFASGLRDIGFKGKIISFEPLTTAHQKLLALTRQDPNWIVHPRCAIGDHDGEIEINIAGNSVSSSVLPMLELHSSAANGSAYVGSERVLISKLDTIAPPYLKQANNPFLKIDTQGFEWQVLDGAKMILPKMCGVLCELSLIELYQGQHLWLEIIQRLGEQDFSLWTLQQGFTDLRDGRALQVDAIFFRKQ